MGYLSVCLAIGLMVLNAAVNVYSSIWLSQWTNDPRFLKATMARYTDTDRQEAVNMYLGVYGGLGVAQS